MPHPFMPPTLRFRFGSFLFRIFDSKTRVFLAGLVVATVAGAVEFIAHQAIRAISVSEDVNAALDAASVGVVLGAVTCALMLAARERRKRVLRDMARVAELNHQVRNALQVIVHSHYGAPSEHAAMVLQSVERIERTLKTLFPVADCSNHDSPRVKP